MNLKILTLTAILSITGLEANVAEYAKYRKAVHETASLVNKQEVRQLLKNHGLDILNVTWEDTGRSLNSSVGPNISDMTIQAHVVGDKGDIEPIAMPVVRYPNFSDKTADLSPSQFSLLVGNEKGNDLKKITLTEYLDNFRNYLTDADSWAGEETSLLAPRDSHVLVSAQTTFLPIPKGGKAFFNPVLFNYQSSEGNPAVLTILATREGTSATIIDNKRNAFDKTRSWGQKLFFNQNGERASLTGQRQSEFLAANQDVLKSAPLSVGANKENGMNMVLLIQVPLIHKTVNRFPFIFALESVNMRSLNGNIENAVIGHGPVEGPFTEIDGLEIKRDKRFPIRVTVQFYKAVEKGQFTKSEVLEFRKQIDKVYKNADYVGSLVTEGNTGRPTAHNVPHCHPIWWGPFWADYTLESGKTQSEMLSLLDKRYGIHWPRFCRTPELFKETLDFIGK